MYIWLWLAAGIFVACAPEEQRSIFFSFLQPTRNSWYFLLWSLFLVGDSINSKIHIKLGVIHFLCSEWNTNLSDGPKFNFLLTEKQRRQRLNLTRDRELIYGLCKKPHSQSRIVLPANYILYRWFISLLFTSPHCSSQLLLSFSTFFQCLFFNSLVNTC